MSTIVPPNEMTRKAIAWINEEKTDEKPIARLIEEASVRFNLGPVDEEFLQRFFKEPSE